MKHRYITWQILLACRSKQTKPKKDIHMQLEETIAERKRILADWERLFLSDRPAGKNDIPVVEKDIHAELAETIAEYKRIRKQWQPSVLLREENSFLRQDREAA